MPRDYDLLASQNLSQCKSGPQLQKHIFGMFTERLWRLKSEAKIKDIVGKWLGWGKLEG